MADEVVETTEEAPDTTHNPKITIMPEDQGEGVGPHFPSGTNTVEAGLAGALDISGNPVEQPEGAPEGGAGPAALKSGDPDDPDDDEYDPSANNIDDVLAYVDANPDEADRVLAAEKAGKNRSTLVSQLEAR